MKKWISLLCFMSLLAFCSCQDDEEEIVFPPSTAEQIADKILSYGTSNASVYSERGTDCVDVSFEIDMPFLLVTDDEGNVRSYLLERLFYMYYIADMHRLILHFE